MTDIVVFDEYKMREIPPRERLDKLTNILKTEKDQSIRWDCVWLSGEIATADISMKDEIANLMVWILTNDDNSVVRHEAAFQIGLHNMRDKIPDLVHSIMNDKSDLVKHEAIEALGLLREQQQQDVLQLMLHDKAEAVRDTALFVIKRLHRLKYAGEYRNGEPM